ncbi:putative Threonine Protease Prss50 [Manis pentadactyla]|nr:putative Threonine Protease Prss50 [Manis pentadactyla]
MCAHRESGVMFSVGGEPVDEPDSSDYLRRPCAPGHCEQPVPVLSAGDSPWVEGVWPQFRTIQEKEVTILNSTERDNFYHRFARILSMVRILSSQMICAEDFDGEQFC